MSDQQDYDQGHLDAAAAQIADGAPGVGTAPPPEGDVAAAAVSGGASATEIDPAALLKQIQAMQARLDTLAAERVPAGGPPVVSNANALRDLIGVHAVGITGPVPDHAPVLAMADDLVDAATAAADNGDGSKVREIAGRIEKWLNAHHPGAGDHTYHAQAVGFASVHVPDSADALGK